MKMSVFLESQAAKIVGFYTGLDVDPLDPGGGTKQLPDFSLSRNGARVGYLEVTSHLADARQEFPSAKTKHGVKVAHSKFLWLVTLAESANVKALRGPLTSALISIEGDASPLSFVQIQHPDNLRFFPNGLVSEVNARLHGLGVMWIIALEPSDPAIAGTVHLGQDGVGNFGGSIDDELNIELTKTDNVAKMQYTDPDDVVSSIQLSEVFVWFDGTPGAVQLRGALATPNHPAEKPRNRPNVPPSVSGVWMATLAIDEPPFAMVIWRHTRTLGWQLVNPKLGPKRSGSSM